MKFVFVMGGSYKGFYLNQLNKIKRADLIIFHQDIFYEFNYIKESSNYAPVTKELINLNQKLKCPILVYGILNKNGIINKCFILCVNGKVSIIDCKKDIYLYIKGKFILISTKIYKYSDAFSIISILDKKCNLPNILQTTAKNYFICDKKGVTLIKNNKIYRKFRKCCNFILSFHKKVL